MMGLNGARTYVSAEQFQHMRQLNPSLQFADEEGGVLPDAGADRDADEVILGTEQEEFLKQENVMSEDINPGTVSKPTPVGPGQLKPGEFQNNDGSGS